MPVVMQSGLTVKILTGETQRVIYQLNRGICLPKRIMLTLLDDSLIYIGNGVNRCQMIGMQVVQLSIGGGTATSIAALTREFKFTELCFK